MNSKPSSIRLRDLESGTTFADRHIGPNADDIAAMLHTVGYDSLDTLADAAIPPAIRTPRPLDLPAGLSEPEALNRLRTIAKKNRLFRNFIGQGYYGTYMPPVIQRNILENPAWYTAYTPYQAEISQGRMEALINFQTLVTDLTGMEIANASLLDEGTAAAEAMMMAKRVGASKSTAFFVADNVYPQTLEVIKTRATGFGIEIITGNPIDAVGHACFGVVLQYPDAHGEIQDYSELVANLHQRNTLVIVATDLLALTLLKPPGEWDADIVIGNSQRFGVPLGFGGPHAAFLACRDAYKRSMPGRLIGRSIDAEGRLAYRLTLQTREQHIRREKATSNICTAQVLLAVLASLYAVYHGPDGLSHIARRIHRLTAILAAALRRAGLQTNATYFDTLTIDGLNPKALRANAQAAQINLNYMPSGKVSLSLDETTTRADVIALAQLFGASIEDIEADDRTTPDNLPERLIRRSAFLSHPVFNAYHSEHELLRYMRRLADKDLALDRGMIPLGSCTMKLNATAEMLPITWPEFTDIHPWAPAEQTAGYRQLIDELETMLCECTGYDAVSLQPNSGAQGEYTGLLAIRAWHQSRGNGHRDICLIPESAHGTNPASAQMAGMTVVVTRCDDAGNIDIEDLRRNAEKYQERLAALMMTYPSTHGVFEEGAERICEIIHRHGGQVYTDGANMNALVGLAMPGQWGSDVSHLNLHKTFAIPHGGGGPGVGPCIVKAHLQPFLPRRFGENGAVGMVSSASYGSASILPITWMYITLMGAAGLRKATQVALLNANYIACRLAPYYPTLYTGRHGLVAHECILDLRPLKQTSGIGAEDVAKRLIDFGFHAPTLSFPVSGTLMVEPTESESLRELNRFCDAMIQIREEIRAIEDGTADRTDNPLKNAPHTAQSVCADEWTHPYSREQAAFPLAVLKKQKYWPPVARVDNVYGDKHVMCSCAPLSADAND